MEATTAKPKVIETPNILAEYLTKAQLGREFGVSTRSLARWDKLGIGPARTVIGRKIYYRRAAVLAWLGEQERNLHSSRTRSHRPRVKKAARAAAPAVQH